MKTFKFSLVLRTRENTDVFITLDDNIYGIHSKRVNILYVLMTLMYFHVLITCGFYWPDSFEIVETQADFLGPNQVSRTVHDVVDAMVTL